MKTIWIVNYYTGTPETAANPRYIELSKFFMEKGYEVLIFNSDSNGIEITKGIYLKKQYGDHKFVHVRSPKYKGNGGKRMYSIYAFSKRVCEISKEFQKPDIILHNIHAPFDYPICKFAKKNRIKYIAEAWDLWPEGFERFGLVSKNNPLLKLAYRVEHKFYSNADAVVITMEGGLDYLRGKHWTTDAGGDIVPSKVHYINNGVNIQTFDSNVKLYPRPDEDINRRDTYKIIYLGSIRLVNNVQKLIEAAEILQKNPKYQFFIYGDGVDRPYLEQFVKERNISNVTFKEKRIPLEEVAWVVSQATVNVMNYTRKIGLHGMSSGKMFQYFAAGKPICCNVKLHYSDISRRNLGIDDYLDTPEQYAKAISTLAEQPESEYNKMCERVRQTGLDFDYNVLAAKELAVIEEVINGK